MLRGPTPADRMLAGQLFGTVAVAVLTLNAEASGKPVQIDAALIFALLAAVSVLAFVRLAWTTTGDFYGPAD